MSGMSQDRLVQQCIQDCLDCRRTCFSMAMTHCLQVGGDHADPGHLGLMMNCASLCQTAADFMLSESSLHPEVCDLCATVCGACAQSCAQLDGMETCERACRQCQESCRRVTHGSLPEPVSHPDFSLPATGLRGGPARQGM